MHSHSFSCASETTGHSCLGLLLAERVQEVAKIHDHAFDFRICLGHWFVSFGGTEWSWTFELFWKQKLFCPEGGTAQLLGEGLVVSPVGLVAHMECGGRKLVWGWKSSGEPERQILGWSSAHSVSTQGDPLFILFLVQTGIVSKVPGSGHSWPRKRHNSHLNPMRV